MLHLLFDSAKAIYYKLSLSIDIKTPIFEFYY